MKNEIVNHDYKNEKKKKEKRMTAIGYAVCVLVVVLCVAGIVFVALKNRKIPASEAIVGTWVQDDGKIFWSFDGEYLMIVVKESAEAQTGMSTSRQYSLNEQTRQLAVAASADEASFFTYEFTRKGLVLSRAGASLTLTKLSDEPL